MGFLCLEFPLNLDSWVTEAPNSEQNMIVNSASAELCHRMSDIVQFSLCAFNSSLSCLNFPTAQWKAEKA